MPTFKRYVYVDKRVVCLFTRKPARVYTRSWVDLCGRTHPLCYLQKHEVGFDIENLPKNRIVEVELNVKLK